MKLPLKMNIAGFIYLNTWLIAWVLIFWQSLVLSLCSIYFFFPYTSLSTQFILSRCMSCFKKLPPSSFQSQLIMHLCLNARNIYCDMVRISVLCQNILILRQIKIGFLTKVSTCSEIWVLLYCCSTKLLIFLKAAMDPLPPDCTWPSVC